MAWSPTRTAAAPRVGGPGAPEYALRRHLTPLDDTSSPPTDAPNHERLSLLAACTTLLSTFTALAADPVPNGLTLPEGCQDWKVIAPSHRTDNITLRVIVGNEVAVRAAREGKTNPWPDRAILGQLVWKDTTHASWPTAQVPGDLVHAEFMFKDSAKHAATGGWGFAHWLGMAQAP